MKTYKAITVREYVGHNGLAKPVYGPEIICTIGEKAEGAEYPDIGAAHDAVIAMGYKGIARWEAPHREYGERVWVPL